MPRAPFQSTRFRKRNGPNARLLFRASSEWPALSSFDHWYGDLHLAATRYWYAPFFLNAQVNPLLANLRILNALLAGILHILLLCLIKVITPHISSILHTLECRNVARFAWKLAIVNWCHGTPGILVLLSTVLRLYGHDPWIDDSKTLSLVLWGKNQTLPLSRQASLVYAPGFPNKGVGLCHGVFGSASSPAADALSENCPQLFNQAVHLAWCYRLLTKRSKMHLFFRGQAAHPRHWTGRSL